MITSFPIKTRPAGGPARNEGFALLITITLLAFLVLLLVSLASLTRVETQVAANNQQLAQARQNALMALNIAVGQLQKYAGPDSRVTAMSRVLSNDANPNILGVWSGQPGSGTNRDPDMWLVSGSETAISAASALENVGDPKVDIGTAAASSELFLVGDNSVSTAAQRIKVRKQVITAPAGSVPGLASGATPEIGHYAWWVGDQGVKASLSLPDRSSQVTYGPWADTETRRRLRQQIGTAPNYFRNSDQVFGYDPLAPVNMEKLKNIESLNQLSLLNPVSSASALSTYVKDHFHDFVPASYAVLASTAPSTAGYRGLMQDISMEPSLLGPAFKAYADYASYMEIASPGDIVRRYRMRTAIKGAGADAGLPRVGFSVAPILSDFLLRFRVSRLTSGVNKGKVVVYSKMIVSLWNPYTSALVPEDLYLEITGLPIVGITDANDSALNASLDLAGATTLPTVLRKPGDPSVMRVKLRFGTSANGSTADKASWLPGRVYSWVTGAGTSNELSFYNDDLESSAGWPYENVPQLTGGTGGLKVDAPAIPEATDTAGLRVKLTNAAGEVLAYNRAPAYAAVNVGYNSNGWKWGYGFRVKQPVASTTDRSWYAVSEADLRAPPTLPREHMAFDSSIGLDPAGYATTVNTTELTEYLIHRPMTGPTAVSPGHDVPLYELPRQPFLSLGELQHMVLPASRQFSLGNSWGSSADASSVDANTLFDRYFFSGLTDGINPDLAKGEPLPNWNMRVAGATDVATVRTGAGAGTGYSSRYLMQGGAFNLNSTSVAAWRAMLSRNRFATADPFVYAQLNQASGAGTGTAQELFADDPGLGASMPAPVFFRFPQSAQETWNWSKVDGRDLSTQAFRQGVRGGGDAGGNADVVPAARALTVTQLDNLANNIVGLIRQKAAVSGPFRTIAEFLDPNPAFGGKGLLETAIAAASINPAEISPDTTVSDPDHPGFSSLTLTAGDIMTSLAPYARARSDTFVVRAYGDAVNPVTGSTAARAYAEAIVQRFPDPVDADASTTTAEYAKPSGPFGRKFKIISFRWLSASDI